MKRKRLYDYLHLIRAVIDKNDGNKSKRYAEKILKQLPKLDYSHLDEWFLYCLLGYAYHQSAEYSRAVNTFYKAYLISIKYNLKLAYTIYTHLEMGFNLLRLNNIDQALSQLQKVEEYYQQHGDKIFPMDKRSCFNAYIFLGDCYLAKNNLEKVKEIIEKHLPPLLDFISTDIVYGNYYHLKGGYLKAIKEYDQAREAFNKRIKIDERLKLHFATIEPKIFLAIIDLLEGKLETAICFLESLLKETRQLKLNELICEVGLLLSKCYSLKNIPRKVASIERQIKPLLTKLDIVWLYEKTKEFEQLYRQLQPIYQTNTKAVPTILTRTVNQYYENSFYKDIIIGQSPAMRDVYQLIEKIASTDLPVLIQGETGTGKELIARAIHHTSLRKEKSWLALNCGAIPETLLENELFGHTKGAFTDAREDKKGYIELTSEGTLFLDEIGDMPLSMQQKLLRALEEKLVWRVGASKPIPVNTRFIFASNRNIEELVSKKLFRLDLFHRINTIVITLPPLRDRKDDIPLLVNHFLTKYYPTKTPDTQRTTPDALTFLINYPWPGNIRELENEIKRIFALYPDAKQITELMLHPRITEKSKSLINSLFTNEPTIKEAMASIERTLIIETLNKCNGNISHTARKLGCPRRQLYRKLNQLRIPLR